jgi:hypothetical protein
MNLEYMSVAITTFTGNLHNSAIITKTEREKVRKEKEKRGRLEK